MICICIRCKAECLPLSGNFPSCLACGPAIAREWAEADELRKRLERAEYELQYQEKVFKERLDHAWMVLRDMEMRYDQLIKTIADGRALQTPPPIIIQSDDELRKEVERLREAAQQVVAETDDGRMPPSLGAIFALGEALAQRGGRE